MTKGNPVGSGMRAHLAKITATVVGLGGVGRGVAVQLAALGVTRLQLVDAGAVGRRTHSCEGYAYEDIGRPKVHATAQACHAINPRLDVHVVQSRSVQGPDLGDAVFCCDLLPDRCQLAWRAAAQASFLAAVRLANDQIDIIVIAGRKNGRTAELRGPNSGKHLSRPRAINSPHVASIAAGLLVAEFVRWASGEAVHRQIRLGLRELQLTVTDLR
jgi:hypothetical protein